MKNYTYKNKRPIVIPNWYEMVIELKKAGYTIKEISKITGTSKTSMMRWLKEKKPPSYHIFSKILFFYSYYIRNKNQWGSENK